MTSQPGVISTETVTVDPYRAYYRLQFGDDNDTQPEDFINPGPSGYNDDNGGIWLRAESFMPALVTVEVWPVGARPLRAEAVIAFDGEFQVVDAGEDPGPGRSLGVEAWAGEELTTRLEPGVWAVLIQVTGQEEAARALDGWVNSAEDDPPLPGPVEHWWVDIIDTE